MKPRGINQRWCLAVASGKADWLGAAFLLVYGLAMAFLARGEVLAGMGMVAATCGIPLVLLYLMEARSSMRLPKGYVAELEEDGKERWRWRLLYQGEEVGDCGKYGDTYSCCSALEDARDQATKHRRQLQVESRQEGSSEKLLAGRGDTVRRHRLQLERQAQAQRIQELEGQLLKASAGKAA